MVEKCFRTQRICEYRMRCGDSNSHVIEVRMVKREGEIVIDFSEKPPEIVRCCIRNVFRWCGLGGWRGDAEDDGYRAIYVLVRQLCLLGWATIKVAE